MVGPTPNSPYLAAQSPTAYLDEVGRAPGRLRIGACTTSSISPKPHQAAVAAVTEAADLLTDLGHDAVRSHGPVLDQFITDYLGWVPYTQLANLTGRPAMTVPLHWTADGLPIGVQFVGRLGAEGQLIRLAS
jgi:Asp-tRNA(Asn)/Glu-tRNA(Gln) amidotransferase A subunit family amidase